MKGAGSLPPDSFPEVTLRAQALQQEPPDGFRYLDAAAAVGNVCLQGCLHVRSDHDVNLMPAPRWGPTARFFVFVYFFCLHRHAIRCRQNHRHNQVPNPWRPP